MYRTILRAIQSCGAENYLIRKTQTESAELYFIRKELDMRRMKDITVYEVTVYRDSEVEGKKMRGFADAFIYPQMDEETVNKAITDAYYAATFAANPFFELPAGKKEEPVTMPGRLAGMSVTEAAEAFAEALFSVDNHPRAWINTAEFFVNRITTSIWNSAGIEVSYTRCEANGEFIVQTGEPQDVEQYQDFAYNDLDTESLKTQAREALETVVARAQATTAPAKGTYDVILSGKELRQLLSFYTERSNAAYIYPGYSNYRKGMKVQGEAVRGEKLNLTLKATVPYAYEGIPLSDRELIRDGELLDIYGNVRFSYYLGIKPTGNYEGMQVKNGTASMAQLKAKPYLHVVSFSGFDMDVFSGHFGGEIRLAYLFDGEKVTPVTGGSVNGSLLELQDNMIFSKETYKDSRYEGPLAVKFTGVPVAGV